MDELITRKNFVEFLRKRASKSSDEQIIFNLDWIIKMIDDDRFDDFLIQDEIMETYQILRDECEERFRKGLS